MEKGLHETPDERRSSIIWFLDNYLKMPGERQLKQLTTMLEADFMYFKSKEMRLHEEKAEKAEKAEK